MAKSKRRPRATNKIEASADGAVIKVDAELFPEVPAQVERAQTVKLVRSTLFTAEFEALIELIAVDRVYRAMLDRLGRRILLAPPPAPKGLPPVAD